MEQIILMKILVIFYYCAIIKLNGASDGARTRDLRRDRPAL